MREISCSGRLGTLCLTTHHDTLHGNIADAKMSSRDPVIDLCECLKPVKFLLIIIVMALVLLVRLTLQQRSDFRGAGYFKRKKEYSLEEEFTPRKG